MARPLAALCALAVLFLLSPLAAVAQTAGDLTLVGYRSDDPDEFAFVALAPIAGGTEIAFTDNGWQASGSFRANEGVYRYTAPTTGLTPGTVVVVTEPSGPALAAAGDQVLAYTGSDAAPSFVYALNVEGPAVWQADATSSNTSALPTGLVNGSTAVAVDEFDNVAYSGPTTGTRGELLAAIGDPANWTGSDTGRPAFPASFTVTGDGGNLPPGFTAALTSRDVVADVPFSFDYDAADADGDPLTFSLVSGPGGATVAPTTGALSWTPSQAQAGQSFAVTVAVTDGEASAQTTATLSVLAEAPDLAPSFSDPTYGVLVNGGAAVEVDYDAEDPEGGVVTYTLVSGPAGASVDPSSGVVTWTASTDVGVYPFVVSASDGTGATSTVDLFVGVRGTILPGLELGALRSELRQQYTGQTLGYDRARDTLYAEVSPYPGGALCGVYTEYCVTLTPGADPSTDAFNKGINAEHTWPQSMGADSEPQRSDMHILYPSKSNVNSSRGNSPYGEVPDAQTQTWYRLDQTSTTIPADVDEWSERGPDEFEPREAVKGDIARAVLYFGAIYESAADQAFLAGQLETLLDWNGLDPAHAGEAARSGLIARYQGNVNPFVLDPTLARRAFVGGAAENGAPVVTDDEAETDQDKPVVVDVLANDADPDGDPLQVVAVTLPRDGAATVEGDQVRYAPDAGFVGTDVFTYTASDGRGLEATATVTVTVAAAGANGAPVAANDQAQTGQDAAVVVVVLANDQDPDGDDLTVTGVGAPAAGTATTDGTVVTYTPASGFSGTDTFAYTVSDGQASATATVTVTVLPVNGPPSAPVVTAPADGATLDLSDDPEGTVAVEWTTATDSDGDQVAYRWELAATESFGEVLLAYDAQEPSVAVEVAALADVLGVGEGEAIEVWHRVRASDGQTETTGPAVSLTVVRGAKTDAESAADGPALALAVFPNPAAGRATVAVALAAPTEVRVEVYDALGRRVAVLHEGPLQAGETRLALDAAALRSGVYVVRTWGPEGPVVTRLSVGR